MGLAAVAGVTSEELRELASVDVRTVNIPCHACIDNAIHSAAGLQLRNECMELAEANGIRSIAFCCISTGVFCFPNERTAEIAVRTVRKCLEGSDIQKVVFNVFQDYDKRIYDAILR